MSRIFPTLKVTRSEYVCGESYSCVLWWWKLRGWSGLGFMLYTITHQDWTLLLLNCEGDIISYLGLFNINSLKCEFQIY